MPRQNTFTVVPNPLGMQGLIARDDVPASKPKAMTSKQAKKLYKQATKQPKLSKAEQRRLELEEQERIRKELDKQKSANKARIAREKKKEKELAEIQARKKKGLPLVDVHPSQDTISRFVRVGVVGNTGTDTKRDAGGNVKGRSVEGQGQTVALERDEANKENIPEDGEGPRKRPRLDEDSQPKVTIPDKMDMQPAENKSRETRPRNIPKQAINEERPNSKDGNSTVVSTENATPVEQDRSVNTSQRCSQLRQSGKGSQSNDRTETSTIPSKDRVQIAEEVVMVLPKPTRLHPDRHLEDMGLSRPRADKEVAHPKGQEVPPPKPPPTRKVVGPLPTGVRPRPILGNTDGNRSTPPKLSKETVTPESYKPGIVNQKRQQQIHKENSQPKPGDSTPKPSVVDGAVGATKALPSPQPHVSPMPPRPRPPVSAHPSSHTAKLTHPVARHSPAAPVHPPKPFSTTANPNKFASPYRPMGPPSFVPQRPSPGPPSFKKPTVRPSNGGIQKPKFLPRSHLQAAASRASPSNNMGKPAVPSNNAPPTSTQLFVMSHLDDLLPSPSQELRELEEDTRLTPLSRPPVFKSLTNKREQLPAFPSKSTSTPGPRRFIRQTSHIQIAPPRPRMQEFKPVEEEIFPFLSTQDLLFSSQDIRELESDTPSKIDSRKESPQLPALKPSPKTASSSPSVMSDRGNRPSQMTMTPAPKSVLEVISQKQAKGTQSSSNPSQKASATPTSRASSSIGDQQTDIPNPRLPTAATNPAAPEPAPPSRPPSPRRWFGSSGVGIQILLAAAESEKTFKEDEERRQEKARREKLAEERRKKAAEARVKRAAEAKQKKAAEERAKVLERMRRQGQEIAQLKLPSARRADSPSAAPEQSSSMAKPAVQANHPSLPPVATAAVQANIQAQRQSVLQAPQVIKISSAPKPKSSIPEQYQIPQPGVSNVLPLPPPSQETDYGDEDLGDALGELGLPGGMGLTQLLGPDRDLSWLDEDDDDF